MRMNQRLGKLFACICLILCGLSSQAQEVIKGKILDGLLDDVLIGANVTIKGTTVGTITEVDGTFELTTTEAFPVTLVISYLGYETQEVPVSSPDQYVDITLSESSIQIAQVEVKASRISEDNKKSALTVESLDVLAIKETASSNFYEGLGTLKNVDLTTASLGFQVINTRGFNSTSPVRSLQIIDGVDNQAPGLNFSLGNFLGSSELDVLKVDLIVGASSAFYGPNAFNGVIKMDTKNPFFQRGLAASVKAGERNLLETAVRWADSFSNAEGNPWMAYKLNVSYLKADDWEAENYDPITDTKVAASNPGGFDAVNIYGDEYQSVFDHSGVSLHDPLAGLGIHYRQGYQEDQLVDYDTRNLKTNAALHFRLNPAAEHDSPELVFSGSFSNGSTVYQGDNRFRLENIKFMQFRTELMKKNKYFLRAYMTNENAGDSYDPYFTALLLQQKSGTNIKYNTAYTNYWTKEVKPRMIELGYPELELIFNPDGSFAGSMIDTAAVNNFYLNHADFLQQQHGLARDSAQSAQGQTLGFLVPGTDAFNEEFNRIITTNSGSELGGTKLVDRSSLYHLHGEYQFNPDGVNFIKVGANSRLYTPVSDSTLFRKDEDGNEFTNFEYGIYGGVEKGFNEDKFTLSATLRMDKNQNFDYLFSPAASLVYQPDEINYFRVSFSSAIRNPTLTDQYLNFNVGRAILSGNIDGVEDLITLESFDDFRNASILDTSTLVKFDIDAIRPEQVKTFEAGYRTTLFGNTYVDAGYYFSFYNDFIGYNIGLEAQFIDGSQVPSNIQAYRYSANSINTVTTQGFSIGLNHYFAEYFKLAGNYSWNKLNIDDDIADDPIIPAFNTPEHKYNVSFGGRKLPGPGNNTIGFNVNYKWVEGFTFEGSPQFTGFIPAYGLVDAQVSYTMPNYHTTLKIGASNILDNKTYQTYGGPRVGRLAYASIVYDWNKR